MIDNVDLLIRRGFRIPVAVLSGKSASTIGLAKTKKLIKKNGKKDISVVHSIEVDEFLQHFGVRGMHWGIRNRRFGGNPVKQRRYTIAKNRHNLSDQQLNTYIDRLQRERALKTLTEDNINPGQRATKEMLGMIGKTAVSAAVGTAAAFFVRKAFMAKFG